MKANAEANVAICDKEFAGKVREVISADIARSEEIRLDQWNQRGVCQRIRECYFGLYKHLS